jgi:hypothetical protein
MEAISSLNDEPFAVSRERYITGKVTLLHVAIKTKELFRGTRTAFKKQQLVRLARYSTDW